MLYIVLMICPPSFALQIKKYARYINFQSPPLSFYGQIRGREGASDVPNQYRT
jgi:hypothetical protein